MQTETITIARRYAGPPESGNGGYTSGRLAQTLTTAEPVTVTLRQPPPLDTPMPVETTDGPATGVRLLDPRRAIVAEATRGRLTRPAVAPVRPAEAAATADSYRGLVGHPFPACFSCGPKREPGDGLRLMPGLVAPGRTACVWVPAAEACATEHVWAALDCPSAWTSDLEARPLVLGRMTAFVETLPRVGEPHVIVGEHLGDEGRKTFTATTLYDPEQRVIGRAEHVWIAIDPAAFTRH